MSGRLANAAIKSTTLRAAPQSYPPETLAALERFEVGSGYDDIATLDGACAGVDAAFCAYGLDPRLQLDGQLLLLLAVRVGIEIYVATRWNGD